jgi:hypothetical protein
MELGMKMHVGERKILIIEDIILLVEIMLHILNQYQIHLIIKLLLFLVMEQKFIQQMRQNIRM